jgi:hypothetical protein
MRGAKVLNSALIALGIPVVPVLAGWFTGHPRPAVSLAHFVRALLAQAHSSRARLVHSLKIII